MTMLLISYMKLLLIAVPIYEYKLPGPTPADPGTGQVSFNSAPMVYGTALSISKTDMFGETIQLIPNGGISFVGGYKGDLSYDIFDFTDHGDWYWADIGLIYTQNLPAYSAGDELQVYVSGPNVPEPSGLVLIIIGIGALLCWNFLKR